MIVSCESCKSRYKIDDSKISGRGARITCPRCKHQFVVYTADKNAGPSMVSQQNPDWDDEPTRVGAKKGDKSGSGQGAAPSNQTITPPPPPASPRLDKRSATESIGERPTEMTPTAAGAGAAASLSHLRAPPPEEEPSGAGYEVSARVQKLSPAEAAARAPTLDFRKVGISAWKVKVKIGLIYDFSDLKTLRKYIQDARVTPADLISHDGKSWRAIGEIPDLDVYFVETYDQLFADQANRPVEEPKPKITPPPIDTSSLASSGSFEEEMDSKRTRARPAAAPTRSSGQAQKPAEGGGNTGLMVGVGLVLALLLAGGMWYVTQGPGAPAPAPAPAPTPASTVDKDQIRKGIIEGMTPVETPAPAPSIDPKLLEPTLTPVGPRGTLTPVPPPGGVPANNGSTVSQKESTAADLLEAGASAERAGRWAEAVVAYMQAAKKDPRNPSIKVRLGVAQYNNKDMNGAQTSLESAIQLGAKGEALRVLGDIYAANGDVAGARDYYQRYLAGNPRDKAAVEQKLQKLNGG